MLWKSKIENDERKFVLGELRRCNHEMSVCQFISIEQEDILQKLWKLKGHSHQSSGDREMILNILQHDCAVF